MDNVAKFLTLIGYSEHTIVSPITRNNGYDIIVSGVDGPERFDDYTDHPFINRPAKLVRPGLYSTAAGRYQILVGFWRTYKQQLNLQDFSPASQDAVAMQILKERRAVPLIEAGQIEDAIKACSNIWASFPGNDYGQNPHSIETLLNYWATL